MKKIEISGKVITGEGYGRKLGFPTINLDRRSYSRHKLKMRLGIYAGFAGLPAKRYQLNAKRYKAAIVIGPIDSSGLPKIEAHLIGFKGNLYGRKVTLYLLKYIRAFKKFKSEKELKAAIKHDVQIIKKIL